MAAAYNLGTKPLNVDCNCQRWIFCSQYGRGLTQLEQGTFNIHKAKIRLKALFWEGSWRSPGIKSINWALELSSGRAGLHSWQQERTFGQNYHSNTRPYRRPSLGWKCLAGSQHRGKDGQWAKQTAPDKLPKSGQMRKSWMSKQRAKTAHRKVNATLWAGWISLLIAIFFAAARNTSNRLTLMK